MAWRFFLSLQRVAQHPEAMKVYVKEERRRIAEAEVGFDMFRCSERIKMSTEYDIE
jgi:hypothetical protein